MFCATCQTYVDSRDRSKATTTQRQTVRKPPPNAGTHWVDEAVHTINDIEYGIERFARDVVHGSVDVASGAVRVAVAAPVVATNVAVGTTASVVGLAVSPVSACVGCCLPGVAGHPDCRSDFIGVVSRDHPELVVEEVEEIVDDLMRDGMHVVNGVVTAAGKASGASASTSSAPKLQAPKPAGAQATMSPHQPDSCECHGCVVNRSVASFNRARLAGAEATAEPVQATPASGNRVPSDVADEYRRRWTGGRAGHRVHHTPHHHRRDHDGEAAQVAREPSRAAYARAETDLDIALRNAGFSYDCHLCQTTVETSKCTGCGEKVPQTYIDSTLGGPTAGSQFMGFMSDGVEALNSAFGL